VASRVTSQVKTAVQLTGYTREKRGFRPQQNGAKQIRAFQYQNRQLNNAETYHENTQKPNSLPNDPLYSKEWYIVSVTVTSKLRSETVFISHVIRDEFIGDVVPYRTTRVRLVECLSWISTLRPPGPRVSLARMSPLPLWMMVSDVTDTDA
jgi:hypothetical protein